MKRIRAAGVLLAAVLLLAACRSTPAPERDLEQMLDYLSGGNISRAEDYVLEGTLNISTNNKQAKRFYEEMFSSIIYVISDSETTDDTAQVTVTIIMYDMEALVAQASLEALDSVFSGGKREDAALYRLLVEKMTAGEAELTTTTVIAYLEKDGGRWKVDMTKSSRFADAVAGGLGELIGY